MAEEEARETTFAPGEVPGIPAPRLPSPLFELADASVPLFADRARRYHYVARWEDWTPVPGGARFAARAEDGRSLTVEVGFVAAETLRLRLDTGAGLPPDPSPLLAAAPRPFAAGVRAEARAVVLATPALVARVERDPWRLSVALSDGRPLWTEQHDDRSFFTFVSYPLGWSEDPAGQVRCHESFALRLDEQLYGLGQQYGPLPRRGQRIVAWSRDALGLNTSAATYTNVPFFCSTRGWGLFLNHPERIVYELGSPSAISGSVGVDAPYLDCFLIAGPELGLVLQRYTDLTGRPPLPPLWSFGVWLSRCMYRDRAEVEAIVARARAVGLPFDVVHLDPLWLKHRKAHRLDACDFVWDEDAFPDPAGFVRWLAERGVKLSLWENPYVWRDTERFAEGAARGYFARTADGGWATSLENPEAAVVDFTNPAAVRWWQDLHRPLFELGVAAFKTDYGEGLPPEAVLADGRSGRQAHNLYPLLYNRAVFEAPRAAPARGPAPGGGPEVAGAGAVVFGRSGTAGSQRYPLLWSGDAQSTWDALAGALRSGLSLSLSGIAFWTHDVGGFWNPAGEDVRPDPELYVRWAQVGLLCSHTRFHGTTPREPWEYGPEALAIVRSFARLRYRLLPYLWQQAHAAHATGWPVVRPLVLHYPDDPLARIEETEFLLGPLLLVAPVLAPVRQRWVYLPAGRWRDFWDGTPHEGPKRFLCPAPLERLPLFVAEDSVLPLAPEQEWVGQRRWDPLDLELRVTTAAEAVVPLEDGGAARVSARRLSRLLSVTLEAPGRSVRLRVLAPGELATAQVVSGAADLTLEREADALSALLRADGPVTVEFRARD